MTIKQQGGIFGRNPTFNEVEVSDLDATNQVHIGTSPFSDNEFVIRKTGSNPRAHISSGVSGTRVAELQMGTETRDWLVEAEGSPYNLTFNYIGTNAPTDNILKLAYGGDVTVGSGNLVIGTSGKGIDFSATSGTGTSELFSDYEEGSFTPNVEGTTTAGAGTYNSRVGLYTKIGNRVMFNLWINMTAHTGSGNMVISGLPYTSGSGTRFHTLNGLYSSNITAPSGHVIVPMIFASTTSISMYSNPTGTTAVAALALDTAFTINISGQYETA